jgi:hypothetical protein
MPRLKAPPLKPASQLLFFDTNVFLSFFHFSKDDLDALRQLVVLVKAKRVKRFRPVANQVDVGGAAARPTAPLHHRPAISRILGPSGRKGSIKPADAGVPTTLQPRVIRFT